MQDNSLRNEVRKHEREDYNIIPTIYAEMESDGENESEELLRFTKFVTRLKEKQSITFYCISVAGHSQPS